MSLTTYTSCIKITRNDGAVLGLTELDADVTIGGQLYQASSGYDPTTLSSTSSLSVNNAETSGALTITGIDRDDLIAGLYDHAVVEFILADYVALTNIKTLGTGNLGEVTLIDGMYKAEYRSLSQYLQQTIGRKYTAECDATLGDTRCGINLATFTYSGTVTSSASNSSLIDTALIGTQVDGYYDYGLVTFTSGLNNGLTQEVKTYVDSTGAFTLLLPLPYTISASDTFTVYAGCNKAKQTCIDKFNNVVRFRGFDMIPGQDKILKFGGQ